MILVPLTRVCANQSLLPRTGEKVPKADEGPLVRALHEPLIRASRTFSPRGGEKETDGQSTASFSYSVASRSAVARSG